MSAHVRKHLASLIGATVDATADHHHVSRTTLKALHPDFHKAAHPSGNPQPCDSAVCGPDLYEVPSHLPIALDSDTILMSQKVHHDGAREWQTISVDDFDAAMGHAFLDGKPSSADFIAACDAIPATAPDGWAEQNPKKQWPPKKWCRGFCQHAAEWQSKGMLK